VKLNLNKLKRKAENKPRKGSERKKRKLGKFSPPDIDRVRAQHWFLNFSIGALVLVVAYLLYSMATKLQGPEIEEVQAASAKPSAMIQIEVLNGCGVNGMGDTFTEFLRESDFDVIHTGNYVSFDVEHTLVVDRRGDPANAAAVAKALGVGKKQIVRELNEDYLLDVSVVIGKDFGSLKPTQ
jgi:hypothetical protein